MKLKLPDLDGMKVLVVEDDRTSLYMLKIIFEKMNAKMYEATDGNMALKMLEEDVFDLILMDVNMPVMDGMTASQRIRESQILNRNHKPIGIIAMTAYAMSGDKEKCIQAGMDDYVSKPIEFDELIRILSKYQKRVKPQHNLFDAALLDLKSTLGLDDESCAMILETYTDQAFEIITEIKHNFGENNFADIASLFHRLKGSSGNARVLTVMEKTLESEEAISSGDVDRAIGILHEIEAMIQSLKRKY